MYQMGQYRDRDAVYNRRWFLPFIFILLALPTTLLFARLTPPFQVPDEWQHYLYARSISLGVIFPRHVGKAFAGGVATATDADLINTFSGTKFNPQLKVTNKQFAEARALPKTQSVPVDYSGAAIYPPSAYALSGIAIYGAKHLGFDPLAAFFAGRIANAFVYVLAGALAVWLTPVGKLAFTMILLLPMASWLAGSYSADVSVFAMSAIVCALLAREAARDVPKIAGLLFAGVLLAALAATKVPMIALVIPLAAIARKRSWKVAIALGLLVISAFGFWIFEFVATSAETAREASMPDVSTLKQAEYLISSPFSIIMVAYNTLSLNWWFYTRTLIGVFGNLDTPLNTWFYLGVLLCLGGVALTTTAERSVRCRFAFILAALLAVALTFGALYASWTKVGADVVSGVQGRYFIPILFPAALAIAGTAREDWIPPSIAILPIAVMWIVSVSYIPLVLVARFYIH